MQKINEPILKGYFEHLKEISNSLGLQVTQETLHTILRLPETVKTEIEKLDEDEWQVILENIRLALTDIESFRIQEGKALASDLKENILSIEQLLGNIEPFEGQRIKAIKSRIGENLESLKLNGSADPDRFEQELLFYLEKLDINEEKVRLKNHLVFFIEVLGYNKSSGKKLGFISQEIGREINTIGSKANNSDIQRIVVEMKDHLERIKEQVLNVL